MDVASSLVSIPRIIYNDNYRLDGRNIAYVD